MYLCQSISPTIKTGGSYVLLSFMSFNLPYKYKTGGSYVLLSFVSVNLPYKHKTGGLTDTNESSSSLAFVGEID
jgi:hypothetical protein